MNDNNRYDIRLITKHIRSGFISRDEVKKHLKALPEETDYTESNVFDEDDATTFSDLDRDSSRHTNS